MTKGLKLEFRRDLPLSDEDFGAILLIDRLLLPYDFEPICEVRRVRDIELFSALVRTDPRAVARAVGWNVSQVAKAWKGLKSILQPVYGNPEQ